MSDERWDGSKGGVEGCDCGAMRRLMDLISFFSSLDEHANREQMQTGEKRKRLIDTWFAWAMRIAKGCGTGVLTEDGGLRVEGGGKTRHSLMERRKRRARQWAELTIEPKGSKEAEEGPDGLSRVSSRQAT
ncbi:hypothetical protein CCUS01_10248 [Colletotrichum cuscutae]|uniref:Uncharacterized protein n=1 Tax=Colletotrichum cuscutae TaxID=1209917 RepID=A0AAI9UHG6_9PEZI|nr:hypothetical protein CCUS01_10248 [Colletotrichum cuscutae]